MTKTMEILSRERERRKLKCGKILWTKLEKWKVKLCMIHKIG